MMLGGQPKDGPERGRYTPVDTFDRVDVGRGLVTEAIEEEDENAVDPDEPSLAKSSGSLLPVAFFLALLLALNVVLLVVVRPDFHKPHNKTEELTWQPYMVLNLVIIAICLMGYGLPADIVLMTTSAIFCTVDIITVEEFLEGLSNSGVVAVAVLCMVSKAIDKTKALNGLMGGFLGMPTNPAVAMLRMALPVVMLGTVFNNTPLVAVMIPIVKEWTVKTGMPVSYFMMPLSFVTMLSACITTMGSSTNLLAVQLVPEADIQFLDMAPVGLVIMVVGVAYCAIMAPCLLHTSTAEVAAVEQTVKENGLLATEAKEDLDKDRYTVMFKLAKDGPLCARCAADCNLLTCLPPPARITCLRGVESQANLQTGDELLVENASADDIASMQAVPGLDLQCAGEKFISAGHAKYRRVSMMVEKPRKKRWSLPVRKWVAASVEGGWVAHQRMLYEVVLPPGGFSGASSAAVKFELTLPDVQKPLSALQCTLIAVRGEHWSGNEALQFRGGEVLLVEALAGNLCKALRSSFSAAIRVADGQPPQTLVLSPIDPCRPYLAVAGLAVCVGLSALEIAPLDSVALLVGILSVVLGTLTIPELYSAVNGPVLLTVAASFGVGAAFHKTGLAAALAEGVLGVAEQYGPYVVLGSVVSLTLVLGVVVSNNTTVILLAPLVKDICDRQGLSLKMVMLAVVYAANLSFATPFSYQTNMMVMPHGGYVFMDYVRFGVPMMLLCGIVALVCTYMYWA
eukprot:TRINITY_DN63455_c0_g1_i1.p1 TRINITY_DN63455_c0_g1~~TRINITY_DN63455_c0_g1_i1.p1  ORF type:complete len:739 (-),score=145.89 TRINITY_DN63455_c0_g1_i1:181-2397(-)